MVNPLEQPIKAGIIASDKNFLAWIDQMTKRHNCTNQGCAILRTLLRLEEVAK